MNGINNMANAFAKAGTFVSGLEVAGKKMAGVAGAARAVQYMAETDSNVIEVNHRPVAQQWAVRTP